VTRFPIGRSFVISCVIAEAWTGASVPSARPQEWSGWAWETKIASGRIFSSIPFRFSPKSQSSRKPFSSIVKAEWPECALELSSTYPFVP